MAYNIIFYEKENGESEIWNFIPATTAFSTSIVTIIILYYFTVSERKLKKTPRREIEKAKTERDDYISRKENQCS